MPHRSAAAIAALLVTTHVLAADAQTSTPAPDPNDAIEVHLATDLPLVVGTLAVGGTMQLLRDEFIQERCAPNCPRESINPLDATTLGRHSDSAHQMGNAVIATSLALPLALGAVQVATGEQSWQAYGEDALIVTQTVGVTVMLHQLVAFTVQRARPYAYSPHVDDALLQNANTYLSFYSGHTANAFAVATSYGYLQTLRHGGNARTAAVWTMGYGLALMQGYLRVTSGYHFWSDVLVGAAAGAATGMLIPWLHTTNAVKALPRVSFSAAPMPGGATLGLTGSW